MLTMGGLVWIYLEHLGQIDSAMVWSEKMIKPGPENPWGYYYLGSVNVAKDNLQRALIEYTKARDLDPNLSLNEYRLAHVYRLLGKYDKAIEILKEILHLNPTSTPAYYDLGLIYNAKGDVDSAKSHFLEYKRRTEHWIDTYPDNPTSYLACGAAYTQLGEKDIGWKIGIKALEIDSTIHFDFAQFLALPRQEPTGLDFVDFAISCDITCLFMSDGLKIAPESSAGQKAGTDPQSP